MQHDLSWLPHSRNSESVDQIGQFLIGNGNENEFTQFHNAGNFEHWDIRQDGLGSFFAFFRDGRDAHQRMACTSKCGTQDGAHLACANNADAEATITLLVHRPPPCRSSPDHLEEEHTTIRQSVRQQ